MKRYLGLLLSVVLVVLDQAVKLVVLRYLKPITDWPVIEDILHFHYLENRGMAFGMMKNQEWLLIWGTAIVLAFLILMVMLGKIEETFPLLSICTIIGGGIGNLIDRVYRGYVIDYIYVKIIDFAIFNFADCCVVVGTILLICYVLFREIRGKKQKEEPADV